MNRIIKFGAIIFFLLLAMASGYYFGISEKSTRRFDWKNLVSNPEGNGYSFTSEALFNSDIALPKIKKISGKYKFINHFDGVGKWNLGYIISVDVDKLNLEKIPQKYKTKRTEKYKSDEFTMMPIEEVTYQVYFEFILKDKDGFNLAELSSPKYSLSSGKINEFQDKIGEFTSSLINQTKDITFSMTIEKCETCS